MEPSEVSPHRDHDQPEKTTAETKVGVPEHGKRRSKKEKILRTCGESFREYSTHTSIHGIQYLGDGRKSSFERAWWLIMIIMSVCGCTYMIYKLWKKWDQSPVIVTFAETAVPVWRIPFPTVTICSEKIVRQTIYNFTEAYHNNSGKSKNFTEKEIFQMESASLLCDENLRPNGSEYANDSTLEFLKSVSHELSDLLTFCEWEGKKVDCDKFFKPIITEDGQCYAFNILAEKELHRENVVYNGLSTFDSGNETSDWKIDAGYPKNAWLQTYPARGVVSGVEGGLSIYLITNTKDADYLCSENSKGFKILLHSPADFPRVSRKYIVVPVDSEMIIAIKPDMLITSEGLVAYDGHRRQCYWSDERRLNFFHVYTQQNCHLECLTNYTEAVCGCVAFWMPRNKDMKICSSGKITCMDDAQDDFDKFEIKYELAVQNNDEGKIQRMEKLTCDCLPGCTSINYNVEISQSDFFWNEIIQAKKFKGYENMTVQFSRVMLFFKESDFIPSRRSELYGLTDFLSQCGGVLGLFLGFSVLSLMEILYYLTNGPVRNLKRKISNAYRYLQIIWRQRQS